MRQHTRGARPRAISGTSAWSLGLTLGLSVGVIALIGLAGCDSLHEQGAFSSPGAVATPGGYIRLDVSRPAPIETARYPDATPNGFEVVAEKPVSTFSIDVDTASYAVTRRFLRDNRTPPAQAVRVEEMVNYFPYAYPAPAAGEAPFRTMATVVPTPWNPDTQLLHIGIKGYDIPRSARPRANIVLLVDVSGSMAPRDRLPLLQQAFARFANELGDDDHVAIVSYAEGTRTVLEPTRGRERRRIVAAIESLTAGGGTAGAQALQTAYSLAERNFDPEAVNRIILATDGDFNIGPTDPRQLADFVAEKRKTGIYLSILGVGLDNLNDNLMQKLAQTGNGNAAYIDSLLEARKVLSENIGSTLFPIAEDVKIQIEFNPARVAEYRLLGYETRMLRRTDFNDDKVDAGEIGSGHTVTAIYEIVPIDSKARRADPLRYQREPGARADMSDEIAFLRLRYKQPRGEASQLIEWPVTRNAVTRWEAAPADIRFSVAVAAFGQKLRGESTVAVLTYADIARLAHDARGEDPEGYRAEFIQLVKAAETIGSTTLSSAR
jgi:Ca-activated chloride channel family protein